MLLEPQDVVHVERAGVPRLHLVHRDDDDLRGLGGERRAGGNE
jgi:hypothetical protein